MVTRTPISTKGKKLEAPIQTSNLFRFFSPGAARDQEAHIENVQRIAIGQHKILEEIKGAQAALISTPQRPPADSQNQAQIQQTIHHEIQLENQLIQADLMQQMASLQRTVRIMHDRIIQLQAPPPTSKIKPQGPAEIEIAAMRHQSKFDKHAIRTADVTR